MRKKTIFILLLLFLATFGFSACTALYEDRDKIVEDEMDKYNVQIAAYDRLEKNFDYTDSVRAGREQEPGITAERVSLRTTIPTIRCFISTILTKAPSISLRRTPTRRKRS